MTRRTASKQLQAARYYSDPNHDYFSTHFEELVQKRGGKWIILSQGHCLAICEGSEIDRWLDEAEKRFPGTIPFATPIPRAEDFTCLL